MACNRPVSQPSGMGQEIDVKLILCNAYSVYVYQVYIPEKWWQNNSFSHHKNLEMSIEINGNKLLI